MSADNDADRSPEAEEEGGGGLLPAILVGAGILIVAALLIFDFGGDDDKGEGGSKGNKAAAAQGGEAGADGKKGGVQSRPYDAAKGRPESKRNPAIKLPNVGMAQGAPPKPEGPPEFANTAEEIAWYEKKLVSAKRTRDDRKKFMERLPKVKARIEASPNAAEGLKTFEGRKKIVEDNYDKAVTKVEEIEAKIAGLRG